MANSLLLSEGSLELLRLFCADLPPEIGSSGESRRAIEELLAAGLMQESRGAGGTAVWPPSYEPTTKGRRWNAVLGIGGRPKQTQRRRGFWERLFGLDRA